MNPTKTGTRNQQKYTPVGGLPALREAAHLTSNVCNLAQAAAVSGDLSDVEAMRTAFDTVTERWCGSLNEIPGVECPEPHGAFYAYPSVKALLHNDIRGRSPAPSSPNHCCPRPGGRARAR